jgi:hypothetical protein
MFDSLQSIALTHGLLKRRFPARVLLKAFAHLRLV